MLLLSGGGDLERGAYRGQFIGEDVDAAVVLATDDPNDLSGPEVAARTFVIAGRVGERCRPSGASARNGRVPSWCSRVNSLPKPFSGFGIVVTQQMGLRGADEGHYQDAGSALRPLARPWPGAVQ